jgi:ATP-dependent DNA helicase RecG
MWSVPLTSPQLTHPPSRLDSLVTANRAVKTALERHAELSRVLGDGRVGIVHGRMKQKDKEKQIKWFKDLKSGVDILVGTTVLEVGIDVPQANILVVEGANRFGLSQLHQLRGR